MPFRQPDGYAYRSCECDRRAPIAANVLKYLLPVPNYGAPDSYANNYQINFPSPISANQGDVRLDRTLSSPPIHLCALLLQESPGPHRALCRLHLHYCAEAGSPLQGAYNTPEIDEGLTFAHNFIFTSESAERISRRIQRAAHLRDAEATQPRSSSQKPALLRSFRSPTPSGLKRHRCSSTASCPPARAIPACSAARSSRLLDNVTWTRGTHTASSSAATSSASPITTTTSIGNYRSGWYVFDGALASARPSAIPTPPSCSAIPITPR